jgi:hypothetical protein
MNENSNPLGNPRVGPIRKPTISRPGPDVTKKQDPRHTERDFARDLRKATRQKP